MTVQTQSSRVVFQGDGKSVTFPFGFRILEPEHVNVFLINTTSNELDGINPNQIKKLDSSDFSVTVNRPQPGMADPGNSQQEKPGGTVKLDGFGAPSTGIEISIERATPDTQLTDYVPNDPFPADTHERALDKVTLIVQENARELGDVLVKAPPGEDPNCPPLPTAEVRADSILGFNSAGCPTTLDINNFDITAPQVLSDLDNVSARNADSREVISFNANTGEWTPEKNVFSINDFHGDITLNTNSDGDIVVEDDKGNSKIVIESTEVFGGASLLKDFTAAESLSDKELVAVRTNGEIETISTTTSGALQASATVIENTSDTNNTMLDLVWIEEKSVWVALYWDDVDVAFEAVVGTVDKANKKVANAGSPVTILSNPTNSFFFAPVAAVWDPSADRLVLCLLDPNSSSPAQQPSAIVTQVDNTNLTLSNIGTIKSLDATEAETNVPSNAWFDESEDRICYGWDDGTRKFGGSVGNVALSIFSTDAANETVTNINTVDADDGKDESFEGIKGSYVPSEQSNYLIFTSASFDGDVWARAFSLSNSSPTFGSLVNPVAGTNAKVPPPVNPPQTNQVMIFTQAPDTTSPSGNEAVVGAFTTVSGTSITVEEGSQVILDSKDAVEAFSGEAIDAHWDDVNNQWLYAGSLNDKAIGVTGTIEGTDLKASPASIADFSTDVNAGSGFFPSQYIPGEEFFIIAATNNSDNFIVWPGTEPTVVTNRNRWIGVTTESGSAGDVITVALRGSDAEVSPSLTPGTIYYLTRDGQLTETKTDFRAGLASSSGTLLTAGIDYRVASDTSTGGSTKVSEAFQKIDSGEISSATGQVDLTLPTDFARLTLEILELQVDTAAQGNNLILRLSNDGGSTFISTTDYQWANAVHTVDGGDGKGFTLAASSDDKLRFAPPPQDTTGAAVHAEARIKSNGASGLFTSIGTRYDVDELTRTGEVVTIRQVGVLRKKEVHDAIRIQVESANITHMKYRLWGAQ